MKNPPKTALVCFVHRKQFAEVHLNVEPYFEIAYDFCPHCEVWMLRNMERDMLGMTLMPFEKPVVQVKLKKTKL